MRRPLAIVALSLASVACASAPPKSVYESEYERCRRWQGTHEICDHIARTKAGPEPGQGRDRWIGMEAVAKSNAESLAGSSTAVVERVHGVGFMVEHDISVEAERCYRVGVAGGERRSAHLALVFVPDPSGARANDHLAGTAANLPADGGQADFCTDRAGRVHVTISSLSEGGFILTNARLEYAIAIASAPETPERRATRQREDAARADDARASICGNCRSAFTRCTPSGSPDCAARLRPCQAGYACE